jgi:hypothetical protein
MATALVLFPLFGHAQILRVVEDVPRMQAPAGTPATLGEALKAFRETKHAEVIAGEIHDDAFVIPISANAQGANGTYFRSDLTIANYRGSDQVVGIGFMAAGVDNTNAPLTYITVPANSSYVSNDFIGSTLGRTGLGAILVFGYTSSTNGSVDSNAELDGFSRIWTPCPTTACPGGGFVSQTFDAVDLHDSLGSLTAYVLGLKQSSDYRTNVGVVNFDSVQHTWTIRSAATGAVTTITVPPISVVQSGLAAGSGSPQGNVILTLNSDGSGFYWSAYGTSVDNKTGDGWVSRAKQ